MNTYFDTSYLVALYVPNDHTAAVFRHRRLLQREIKSKGYPKSMPAPRWGRPPGLPEDDEECQCPECCAKRGELPELPPELLEMVDELGPETVVQALAEILGIGGKKKRRKPRSRYAGDDFPF